MMRFDLVDLSLFRHVVEAGSITHGAARVNLALAAASTRIRGLEDSLGAALLTRSRLGASPTPAGRALLAHARTILAAVETLLTFCPPGPAARMNTSSISSSGMIVRWLTRSPRISCSMTRPSRARPQVGRQVPNAPSRDKGPGGASRGLFVRAKPDPLSSRGASRRESDSEKGPRPFGREPRFSSQRKSRALEAHSAASGSVAGAAPSTASSTCASNFSKLRRNMSASLLACAS